MRGRDRGRENRRRLRCDSSTLRCLRQEHILFGGRSTVQNHLARCGEPRTKRRHRIMCVVAGGLLSGDREISRRRAGPGGSTCSRGNTPGEPASNTGRSSGSPAGRPADRAPTAAPRVVPPLVLAAVLAPVLVAAPETALAPVRVAAQVSGSVLGSAPGSARPWPRPLRQQSRGSAAEMEARLRSRLRSANSRRD